MENESSESDFMELSDDVFEDSGDGDDMTTSEIEQSRDAHECEAGEPKRSQNPYIKYCQEQKKIATKFLQKNKVELTEELRKRMTKVVAKDWKALPVKKRKQSAAQGPIV